MKEATFTYAKTAALWIIYRLLHGFPWWFGSGMLFWCAALIGLCCQRPQSIIWKREVPASKDITQSACSAKPIPSLLTVTFIPSIFQITVAQI